MDKPRCTGQDISIAGSGLKGRLRVQINCVIHQVMVLAAFFVIFLVFSSTLAQAVVIGANKGAVDFRNVLKNGYAKELVTFTTDTDFDLSVDYKIEGEIADWVTIEPADNPFYTSKGNPYVLGIVIQPPGDVQIDQYKGSIRFITGALGGPDAQFGTSVRTAININLGVQVTGQEILACRLNEITMEDVEEGYPFEMYTIISNNGNVRIRPEIILEFWNQDQTVLVRTFNITSPKEILPTLQERLFSSFAQDLPIGQYWVRVKTPICGNAGSSFITVSVIERGGVSDKGELVSISNEPDAVVGQIVPIDALFRNLGERVVSAKFKGTVTSGSKDNIFKVIDTEPIDVPPGESAVLRTYFNPTQEGQYTVTGRVLYNRKLTFDKVSILNVYLAGTRLGKSFFSPLMIVIIMILAVIMMLLLLIFRSRRKSRHRHRY